jgi:hypothetical protein
MPVLLAQTPNSKAALLAFALIGLVLLLGLVVMVIRNRTLGERSSDAAPDSLLTDLRRLRDDGRLSEAEYGRYRANIAARIAGRPLPHPNMPPIPGPDGLLHARAGYDLTGEPLPGSFNDSHSVRQEPLDSDGQVR